MALDTRGFMTGALAGFNTMERYQARKDNKERTDRLDEENNRRYNETNARANKQESRLSDAHKFNYGANGEKGYIQKKSEQELKLNSAQIASHRSKAEIDKDTFEQNKRIAKNNEDRAWRQEMKPVIEQHWITAQQSGNWNDPFWDTPQIENTVYDPRLMTTERIKVIENAVKWGDKFSNGELKTKEDNKQMVDAMAAVYRPNFKASIGTTDVKTGKVIKDNVFKSFDIVADIDENQPGDQPGFVMMGSVTYEGDPEGTPPVDKPITVNRSTDQNDNVKVVSVADFMADIGNHGKMARMVASSNVGDAMFNKNDANIEYKQQKSLKYFQASAALGKERAKAISEDNAATGGSNAIVISAAFEEQEQALVSNMYSDNGSGANNFGKEAVEWSQGNGAKSEFILHLLQQGLPIERMSKQALENNFNEQQNNNNKVPKQPAVNSPAIVDNPYNPNNNQRNGAILQSILSQGANQPSASGKNNPTNGILGGQKVQNLP